MDFKALIEKMTVREKVLQLLQLEPTFFAAVEDEFNTGPKRRWQLSDADIASTGTVINFSGASKLHGFQDDYMRKNPYGLPLMTMLDVIHGYRTVYPIPLGLAASWDMDIVRDCTAMAAKEASYDGIQLTFAPMVDLVRDARWGRVAESPGEDPLLCSDFARASVEGFQGDLGEGKLAACVKHYAAYGAAEAGRDYNTTDMSERTLREFYLPAYKAAIDAGATTVMSSFNAFNGVPSSGNKLLMKDILRDEWGFDGVTVSDYAAMWELIPHGVAADEKEAAYLSMEAGMDLEMMTVTYARHLEALIEEGKIDLKQLDEAVLRILKLKEKMNLYENPYHFADEKKVEEVTLCKQHRDLARRAAEACAVLLKNDGALPLNKRKCKIALIGPNANTGNMLGCWSGKGKDEETVTVLQGIKNLIGEGRVGYAQGCEIGLTTTDESMIPAAVDLAKTAETVVLCIGEHKWDTGESSSRMDITLTDVQLKLFDEIYKVNDNIVVVLFAGRPMDLRKIKDRARAILCMWWPGTEAGNATANLLFGEVVPSGKITMSFPWAVGQCPIYYNRFNTGRPRSDDWKRCSCQSAYIDGPNSPLYPFGYGLSYTTFEYSDLKLSADKMERGGVIKAGVKVKNTGDYKAKEVVQLYIRDLVGSVVRPIKELKGYQKIELDKGEEKLVEFTINEDMLAFYGADMTRKAEEGKFRVFIGTNSDVKEYLEFELL